MTRPSSENCFLQVRNNDNQRDSQITAIPLGALTPGSSSKSSNCWLVSVSLPGLYLAIRCRRSLIFQQLDSQLRKSQPLGRHIQLLLQLFDNLRVGRSKGSRFRSRCSEIAYDEAGRLLGEVWKRYFAFTAFHRPQWCLLGTC